MASRRRGLRGLPARVLPCVPCRSLADRGRGALFASRACCGRPTDFLVRSNRLGSHDKIRPDFLRDIRTGWILPSEFATCFEPGRNRRTPIPYAVFSPDTMGWQKTTRSPRTERARELGTRGTAREGSRAGPRRLDAIGMQHVPTKLPRPETIRARRVLEGRVDARPRPRRASTSPERARPNGDDAGSRLVGLVRRQQLSRWWRLRRRCGRRCRGCAR
jgi:hypothetical protein